jgi:hypothetical protein
MRVAVALAIAAIGVALVVIARSASPMYPLSDEALIELATLNTLSGPQLLGAYSRFGWNHPGPMLFYLLAPIYALSGHATAALSAGALAINLAALAAIFVVVVRRGGPALTFAFAVLFALYLSRLEPLLVSSWNAHVDLLACAAVMVIGAAVAAGRVNLLPLLAVAGSFVVQSHVAVLPLVATVALMALARRVGDPEFGDRAFVAAVIAVVLWAPPFFEAVAHGGGNAAAMWAFAADPALERPAPMDAYAAWARMLTSVVRGQLTLPGLPAPPDTAAWPMIAAPLLVAVLAPAAWWARQRRRHLHQWIAIQALAAALAALAAVLLKPGEILEHEVFWITVVGLVAAAAAAAFVLAAIGERLRVRRMAAELLASAAVIVLITSVAIEGFDQLGQVVSRSGTMNDYDRTVRDAAEAITAELARRNVQRAEVTIDNRVWDTAAGIILQLRKRGVPLSVDASLAPRYPGAAAADGSEDARLQFCGGPCHEQQLSVPGNTAVYVSGVIAVDLQVRKSG